MTGAMRRVIHIGALDASPRQRLQRLASLQHGTVAAWQLLGIGYSRKMIAVDVSNGRLVRLYRGVYAVGHSRLSLRARWMAAVLACGPDAVLSHGAAAALHALRPARGGLIDVTVPGHRVGQAGIRVHCVRALRPEDCDMIDGIPVTALERTLLDYAEVSGEQWTRLAIEAAQRQDALDADRYHAALARNPAHRGRRILRLAMSQLRDEPPWTQSEVERRLLAGLRAAGVSEPELNVLVEGELLDLYWREERLNVETDGDFWHRTPAARERDRRRDVKLQLHGQMVARFGDHRVMHELNAVVGEVQALLGRRRAELAVAERRGRQPPARSPR